MAYPAKLFMQREEELPDPNVDPIGYAEALQRREAARSVAAAGPASLDPLEAAAAPIAADPMLDAPPIAELPAPDMAPPMEMPDAPPVVDIPAPDLDAPVEMPAANNAMAAADRQVARMVARIAQQSGLGSEAAWSAFNTGGMPELRRVADGARADDAIARRNNVTIQAQMRHNPMLLLGNPNLTDWQRYVVAEAMLGGERGMGPNELAAAQVPDARMQELQVRLDEGAANRALEMQKMQQGFDQHRERNAQDLKMFEERQTLARQEMEARMHKLQEQLKEQREAAAADRQWRSEEAERERKSKAPPDEDPRIANAKAVAATASARAADQTGAGIEDLIAGKFTPEALKELDRLAELYDAGDENAGALWWSPFSGVGGMSDGDESNLQGYLIGLGVPADVAASGARQAADKRRMFRSDKRGPLPPGAARPRE